MQAPLTVFHAIPDFRRSAGGIAAVVRSMVVDLRQRYDIDYRILCHNSDSDEPAFWVEKLDHITTGLRSRMRIRQLLGAAKAKLGDRLVCHSHGLWDPLNHLFLREATRAGIPVVVSPHGMLMPWARQHKRLRKAVAWKLYQLRDLRRAACIHVTSSTEAEVVGKSGTDTPIAVIPFGVPIQPNQADQGALHKGDFNKLGYLGRIHPIKNLTTLLEAWALVSPSEWRLVIAGPDEENYKTVLIDRIKFLGCENTVRLIDAVYGEEKDSFLQSIDALVLPSWSENYGAVVAEAMMQGLPVVVSTGAPWSRVADICSGWWVQPTVDGLAEALQELTQSSAVDRAAMGLRGRSYAEENLSLHATSRRLEKLYRHVSTCGENAVSDRILISDELS